MNKTTNKETNKITTFVTEESSIAKGYSQPKNLTNLPFDEKQSQLPSIFNKKINDSSSVIALAKFLNPVGRKIDDISFSKQWRNTLYFYNKNSAKNISSDLLNLHKLLKIYFNLYFNHLTSWDKYKPNKIRPRFLNKIYVSRPDVKYTNFKTILTLYTYNRERLALLASKRRSNRRYKNVIKLIKSLALIINTRISILNAAIINNQEKLQVNNWIKLIFKDQIVLIRKYKFKLNLNQYKFEKKFLAKISPYIKKFSSFSNKQVEFNIVNLKSIGLNTDIFTKIAALKTKKKYANMYKIMFYVLNSVNILKKKNLSYNLRKEKGMVNLNLVENRFSNYSVNSIIRNNNVWENYFFNLENSETSIKELYKMIFNSINYKNVGGIKIAIKGRLTKRYRADRAVNKFKSKGGLKNADSSYKGYSVVRKIGYLNPNIQYSISASKRRIGSFAVKGWISSE